MAGLSSPPRLVPPTPRRVPSPAMSPGGRRGRSYAASDENPLRHLSPATTLRAFTQQPMPYDTTRDEYKIFGCIEALTPAERDLGTRVAKAAQRLKSWCEEIEQWGWSGTFEPPSNEFREKRRKSLERRIREHVKEGALPEDIPELEYWGSLLSVEVESHEARLDEMGDELLALDIEELKEHVLDMHPSSRSRPSSAGYEAARQNYTPVDDFSFLITQTLLSALPHHLELNDRLSTWNARVSILREAPRYLADLQTSRRAMRFGWQAIVPPDDTSDDTFLKWKSDVTTVSGALQSNVSGLGARLDRMLDTLEGRDDCLPDEWIDTFENLEAEFRKWASESRRRVMEFDVRRRVEQKGGEVKGASPEELGMHSRDGAGPTLGVNGQSPPPSQGVQPKDLTNVDDIFQPRSVTAVRTDGPEIPRVVQEPVDNKEPSSQTPTYSTTNPKPTKTTATIPAQELEPEPQSEPDTEPEIKPQPKAEPGLVDNQDQDPDSDTPVTTDESIFDEGDTVVHNEVEDSQSEASKMEHVHPESAGFSDSPIIIRTDTQNREAVERPQTPSSRRGSIESLSSSISFSSSPQSIVEESPSVRMAANRPVRAPKPELNAAMGKRRAGKKASEHTTESVPWPPTFVQKSPSSAEELDRKISDILTTIPAHIRLTSNTEAEAQNVKEGRRVTSKGSKGYLRATHSTSGIKSPELTLSPAKQDFELANALSGRKSASAMRGDNDIKLYHLTQPGREKPIKLFIRRVGENGERVMVRVGGGWADLGEYLRQYAEHHGRRTVSDGKFEILGLEVKNTENSPGRPESAMSKRDRRLSGGLQTGSPNTTPSKTPGIGMTKDEPPPPMPSFTSTPGANAENSTPSTGSSHRSWQGNEVGLAGPKSKKLDLSGEKLEWVEGMMKQARTVSGNMSNTPRDTPKDDRAESRSESRTGASKSQHDFGDLGKVGGTKRLFLRGGGASEH